jgi:alkylation response protein AidB-like acyl-CoA dehydrogenase
MEFSLTPEQRHLQDRCLALATDFATRSSAHDRDASHPIENYDILRREGFLGLTVSKDWGGLGHGFLDHTLAYEALGQGCPATALAFNMHTSVVMPLMESPDIPLKSKQLIAELVIGQRKLIGGNFSEPGTTSIVGARPLSVVVKRQGAGYSATGRKMFASMLEAADFVLMMGYPADATEPGAGMLLLIPPGTPGRGVNPNWDTLGMRATRSDQLVLQDCWVPEANMIYRTDDIRPWRSTYNNWFWGSYSAVYLGVAIAAYNEIRRIVSDRQPHGYAQKLAYHPDIRRHIAIMSADIQASRLAMYHSAWLYDREGSTPETNAALFRAKYLVGETVSRVTRTALTLGGAHGIFKGSRLEQLFRDGAIAEIQPPPADFCLWTMGIHELGLDPASVMPPMRAG